MIRAVAENVVLFLLPTLLYLLYVFVRRGDEEARRRPLDDAPFVWLAISGAILVISTLFLFGTTDGGRPGQTYRPPVFKDGHIEPGKIE